MALVGGGVRSGKSAFAVELAMTRGKTRVFVATARPSDDEMKARIDRHQRDRGGAFDTVEAPLALADTLSSLPACDVVVVDCLTLWLSNLLLRGDSTESILDEVDGLARVLARRAYDVVLVTNEVGMSIHPPTALGRAFVEITGWAHQRIARVADDVYLAVLGIVLQVRPVFAPAERAAR